MRSQVSRSCGRRELGVLFAQRKAFEKPFRATRVALTVGCRPQRGAGCPRLGHGPWRPPGLTGPVKAVAFSPDCARVLTGSDNMTDNAEVSTAGLLVGLPLADALADTITLGLGRRRRRSSGTVSSSRLPAMAPPKQGTTAPPPGQTNFTSVPVPLSGARVKLDFE
jgi:hypothetical protein